MHRTEITLFDIQTLGETRDVRCDENTKLATFGPRRKWAHFSNNDYETKMELERVSDEHP